MKLSVSVNILPADLLKDLLISMCISRRSLRISEVFGLTGFFVCLILYHVDEAF